MKLNYRRTFFVGLAFLSICAFWQMYDNVIPLILKNTFHLGETWTGVVMAMDNVLALMLLPLFGMLSDKLRTPLGRRTPFILVGTVLAVICMILLPVMDNAGSLTGFFIALGAVLLSMGFYRSPAVALMPDLTPKPLRSKANAVINLMGALGGIFTLVMISVLVPKTGRPDYMPLFLSVAAVMVVAVVALLLTIRENRMAREAAEAWPEPEEEPVKTGEKKKLPRPVLRSLLFLLASVFLWFTAYNAVTTAFSRYAEEVWGMQGGGFASCLMVATGVAVVSYLPIGFLSSRFGRKKMILAGILLMCAAYVSGIFFGHFSPLLYVVFGLTGVGWASINVNSYPMVVEMGSGADVGKYTGMYYFFSMGAQVFTPIFSGVLLEHISYRTLFPYAAVFSLLSFITMLFVRHGDVKPQKKASVLENFDVDDG
ncbi:MAG: MFS transporter [Oscillospiraceae bacterium]|nr:MFS transporter [Oscillospiraceae bacterium]